MNSEIVASLVGELLFNERFLRRYAQRSEGGFKRALGFLKELGAYIKAKDKAAYAEVNRAIALFENAMLSESGETKDGKRYSVIQKDGKYYNPTDEEIIKKHPTISAVKIDNAQYSPMIKFQLCFCCFCSFC